MTVISALISKVGIAVATDSMLTTVDKNGSNYYLEWEQPKLIPIPKLRACISYWGFAGTLKQIPKKDEDIKWIWQTYEWLKEQCLNPPFDNLNDFTIDLTEKLKREISKMTFAKPTDKGIGIHIAGFENIEGYWIPELFLISNYSNPNYQEIKELGYSRNTYHSIAKVPPSAEHGKKEFRLQVKQHLDNGGLITYNNGDPIMFNLVSGVFYDAFKIAQQRNVMKRINNVQETIPIVKRPIEIISGIQRDFYLSDKKIVGGKIHDITIANSGLISSLSGDL